MAKIVRKVMKMFGSTAGTDELAQFGSLAAAAPAFVNDGNTDTIQALPAWLAGFYDAVIGGASPAIQDMNALLYVFAYQLCYGFQAGVSEWNAATTYYIGSLVNNGFGDLYVSITDANVNNAITDGTNWRRAGNSVKVVTTVGFTVTPAYNGVTLNCQTSGGAIAVTLPTTSSITTGFQFTVKDVSGSADVNALTIVRSTAEQIEGLAATYRMETPYGAATFQFDGANWWIK